MPKTSNAIDIIDRMVGDDEELRELIDAESVSLHVAQMIYDARNQAGLTQKELARLVGTTQSVIARLEDSDYGGHSLNMLQRIAAALQQRVDIRFVPRQSTAQPV